MKRPCDLKPKQKVLRKWPKAYASKYDYVWMIYVAPIKARPRGQERPAICLGWDYTAQGAWADAAMKLTP